MQELNLRGYACITLVAGYGIVGFRDPNGYRLCLLTPCRIRPLVYGSRTNEDGTVDYMIASESVSLDALGYKNFTDVEVSTRLKPG